MSEKAKEYLRGLGHDIDAIVHPQDRSLINSEIDLFKLMEGYKQHEPYEDRDFRLFMRLISIK